MVKVAILHEGNAKKTNDNELLKLLIQELELDGERVVFFGMGIKSNFFKPEHPSYKNLKNSIENEVVTNCCLLLMSIMNTIEWILGFRGLQPRP